MSRPGGGEANADPTPGGIVDNGGEDFVNLPGEVAGGKHAERDELLLGRGGRVGKVR